MRDKNSFAVNPPMGWNSWDCYGAAVTEEILKKNADYMAEHLSQHGWEYIVCDIQWYCPSADSSHYQDFCDICIDGYGRAVPAPNRFPSAADGKGFAPVAEYVHAKGLKFGIHIMRGIPRQAVSQNCPVKGTEYTARQVAHPASICSWNTDMYGVDATKPGAQDYYNSLLELYASWGVDFIKVDDICVKYAVAGDESTLSYGGDEIELIRRAVDRCGRPIVLSLSPGPALLSEAEHLKKNANMWRITNDFWDDWGALCGMFERCREWAPHVSAGCFPDCDMLPLGHLSLIGCENGLGGRMTRFTREEQRTMMTLWCIFRSPLMLGCELNDMDEWTRSLITNDEVLALTRRSRNARQMVRNRSHIVWKAEDADGECTYAALFSTAGWEESYVLSLAELELEGRYAVTELWDGAELGETDDRIPIRMAPHSAKLFRLVSV
ncbi:glycoside hydrolase family 27 protein [Lachnoclostridium sp. Marseille-P6806]|uniref:glycoside hydrolase family 27 protein n=1 Tax=Lachnoclostridium sp. Marseille-P6806 TaxID=2364793 RepID=UPI00102F5BB2|nr:glycoside hydrolase family 27 protein [Lachnoclostridium sp. Marseille-P6806]